MQEEVDAKPNQDASHSFFHAMRDATHNQNRDQANFAANTRVHALLASARSYAANNDHKNALKEVGRAMHTMQDSTSPSHHGFQPWYDYWGGAVNPHEVGHAAGEALDPGPGSNLYKATSDCFHYFSKPDQELPLDFFGAYGADGAVDQIKGRIRATGGTIPGWLDSIADLFSF